MMNIEFLVVELKLETLSSHGLRHVAGRRFSSCQPCLVEVEMLGTLHKSSIRSAVTGTMAGKHRSLRIQLKTRCRLQWPQGAIRIDRSLRIRDDQGKHSPPSRPG